MARFSGMLSHYPVLGRFNVNPMLSFRYPTSFDEPNPSNLAMRTFVPGWVPKSPPHSVRTKHVQRTPAMSRGGRYPGLKFDDDFREEDPFWLHFFKETVSGLKSLVAFLVEQPAQLKYIEWPSFQHTLRTATLTLVLVAMLIVALSCVDSALSFLLALFLQRRV